MRPEAVPQLAQYPNVQRFVRDHLAMQFGDVRAMLRLPIGGEIGIDNGCNFAAAATICNIISGISVVLFNRKGRPPGPRQKPSDRGRRFRNLLRAPYYPWQKGEDPAVKTDVLYELARNSLAHALGVLESGQTAIICEKPERGLTQVQVNALEVAYDGQTLPSALIMSAGAWRLNSPHFYAASVEMFRALICDAQQMHQTEACFARGELTD